MSGAVRFVLWACAFSALIGIADRAALADERAGTLHLAPGPFDEAVRRALKLELPLWTVTSSTPGADLQVALGQRDGALEVNVNGRDGGEILRRRIPLQEGIEPAIRAAVLIVTRTALMAASGRADPESYPDTGPRSPQIIETPTKPDDPRLALALAAMAGVRTWTQLDRPRLTLGLLFSSAPIGLGLRIEVEGIVGGIACCTQSSSGLSADIAEYGGLADVAVPLREAVNWSIAALAGFGADYLRGTAKATGLAGPAEPVSISTTEALLIGGLEGDWRPANGLAFRARAGVRLNFDPQQIELPDGLPRVPPLSTGVVEPWAEVGIAVSPF
jgi:hypothetical protein